MSPRISLAALLGGLAILCWGFISHMALPIEAVKALPNQDAFLATVKASVTEPGFYLFPYEMPAPGATKEQQQAAMARADAQYRAGPTGVLVVHPEGLAPFGPRPLLLELLTDVLEALIAAWLLSIAVANPALGGFFRRVGFVTALGALAWVAVTFSYWIWYGFPTVYVVGEGVDQIGGAFLAGLVLAWRIKPPAA